MNSSGPYSDPTSETRYFDPEAFDGSEQQFAVSLEEKNAPSGFVVEDDTSQVLTNQPSEALSGIDAAGRRGEAEHDGSVTSESSATATTEAGDHDWRNLVSEKVNSYKSRRPQKTRYPSLQLPFDASRWQQSPDPADEASSLGQNERDFPPDPPHPGFRTPILLESSARVLEFPRPASAPPPRLDELAEPVVTRPRIVEAPELVPPPPAMGGILIEAPAEPEPEPRPGFDIPLQPATLSRRGIAGAMDLGLIAAAIALFGCVALRIIAFPPSWRTEMTTAALLLAAMWPIYQYCFLVFCGTTPGLRMTGLRLERFNGEAPTRASRRWRTLASLISIAALGLGYVWCFLDEDQLSWHDRITRTHLAHSNGRGQA
jgi:hypothetical protein